MKCASSFEVLSGCSVCDDDKFLEINHPRGLYRARIKNIPRREYTKPFLLEVHLYFSAPNLDEARDIAEGHLADVLNFLSVSAGAPYKKSRIRQIIDAGEIEDPSSRTILCWGDRPEYDDPQPFLDDLVVNSMETLMQFDHPPAVSRAMRWFRTGLNAEFRDDQFTYFWLAIEILATHAKTSSKVPDKCPHCRGSLYCPECEKTPLHKPYEKQAIRDLLLKFQDICDEEKATLLAQTRNSLMHGATLREIQGSLPDGYDNVVDCLGELVWRAIVIQFPPELVHGIPLGQPGTYFEPTMTAVATIQTAVPQDSDGNFEIDFSGVQVQMKPFGPPQSARRYAVEVSQEQFDQLRGLSFRTGDDQEMLQRVAHELYEGSDKPFIGVLATDMAEIRQRVEQGEQGEWQTIFRQIFDTGAKIGRIQ
ncbi:hypothetical protein BXY70_0140 [Roseovarius halotolerans]|uniref:Uncharacterized protein n=1 Tax=Roseovarius halotolerans TaxID=505353 RepID=A0A1X6YNN9_9RHOB|nr:hypothetical protein BXY70_0140 [Roseovarius halotolerans]SLN26819.1 hypothetical protein ROH8110_01255 [Roseovarius halotolerans]